jgi:hypothetical protein
MMAQPARPPACPQVIDYKGLTYIEDKEDRDAAAKALVPVMGRYGVGPLPCLMGVYWHGSSLSAHSGPS